MTTDPKCKHCGVKKSAHHVCTSCVCCTCPQKPDGTDECFNGFEPEEDETTALATTDSVPTVPPPWIEAFKVAVQALATDYAVEQLREQQRWASDRGHSLQGEEIAKIFINSVTYMAKRILRTSKMDGYRPCPRCHDTGWYYVGPGRDASAWAPCDHKE